MSLSYRIRPPTLALLNCASLVYSALFMYRCRGFLAQFIAPNCTHTDVGAQFIAPNCTQEKKLMNGILRVIGLLLLGILLTGGILSSFYVHSIEAALSLPANDNGASINPISYTHLTLATNSALQIHQI